MAVSVNNTIGIYPIFREPNDPRKYALIARFASSIYIEGDGSGGALIASHVFTNVAGILGQHALFLPVIISVYTSGFTSPYGYYNVMGGERTSYNGAAAFDTITTGKYYNLVDTAWAYPYDSVDKMLYKFGPSTAQLNQYIYPNGTNRYIKTMFAGLIFDERYLDMIP